MKSPLTLIITAVLISGCTRTQPLPQAPSQPLPSAAWIAAYRASIENASPGSVVGIVNAVAPDSNLASVTDVPAGSLNPKQTMTFVDGDGNPLVVGTIVNITEFGNLHVKYETPVDGRRTPQIGDVAVWLKQ